MQEGSHEHFRKRAWLVTLGAPVPEGGYLVSFPGGDTGTSNDQEGNYCIKFCVVKDISLDRTALLTMEAGMLLSISILQFGVYPDTEEVGMYPDTEELQNPGARLKAA